MNKSKKIFLFAGLVFIGLLLYASLDIARRTTFPGSKPQLKERLKDTYLQPDSLEKPIRSLDTLEIRGRE